MQLIAKYEAYAYTKHGTPFKSFLERFTKCKIQYTGFPVDCLTEEDKTDYVDSINEGMRWAPGNDNYLHVADIEDNPAQKSFYKVR